MRKQLRILLFAALVAILVVMTALVISADYTVTDKNGANATTHATLAEAVAAVTDGGTITVNGDVTDVATDLSKEGVSYTIKGGSTDGKNTLTLSSALTIPAATSEDKATMLLLRLDKGSVTFENVAIVGDFTIVTKTDKTPADVTVHTGTTVGATVYVFGGSLTLKNSSLTAAGENQGAITVEGGDGALNLSGATVEVASNQQAIYVHNGTVDVSITDASVVKCNKYALWIANADVITVNNSKLESAADTAFALSGGTFTSCTISGDDTVVTTPSGRAVYVYPTAVSTEGLHIAGGYFYGKITLDFRSSLPISITGGTFRATNVKYGYGMYINAADGCNISFTGGNMSFDNYHTVYVGGKINSLVIGGDAYIDNLGTATNGRTFQISADILTKTEGEGDNAVTTVVGKGIEITGGTIVNQNFRAFSIEKSNNIFKMSGGVIETKLANFGFYAQGENQIIEITGGRISAAGDAIYLLNSATNGTRFEGTVTISNAVIESTKSSTALSVNGDVALTISNATITSVPVVDEPVASAGAIYVGATVNGITVDISGTYDEATSKWSTNIVGSQGIYINAPCTLTIDGAFVSGTAGAGLVVYGASTVTFKDGVICSTATEGNGIVTGTDAGKAVHGFGAHAVWLRSASTFNMEGGTLTNVAAVPALLMNHGEVATTAYAVNISGGEIYAYQGAAIGAHMGVATVTVSGGVIMSTATSTVVVSGAALDLTLNSGVLGCYAEEIEEPAYAPALVDFGGLAGNFTVNGGVLVPYVTGLVVINAKEAAGDEAGTVVTAGDNFAIVSQSGVAFAGMIFGYDTSATIVMGPDEECMGWAQYKGSTELVLDLAEGATARVVNGQENQTGIRFSTTIDATNAALILGMKDAGSTVSYGTLIAPADYVIMAGGFTHAAMEAFEADYEYDVAYVDVVANVSLVESAAGISFNAALVNIKEENMFREFVAVSYVCIDGTYYYSDFSTENNMSMMTYVAEAALEDVSDTKAGVYAYPSVTEQGKFSRYTEACQNYLLAYLPE